MTEILRPKTFYEWLLLMKQHHLKLSRLEGLDSSLVHHALDGKNPNLSYGMWDHQAAAGYLDLGNRIFIGERHPQWDELTKR